MLKVTVSRSFRRPPPLMLRTTTAFPIRLVTQVSPLLALGVPVPVIWKLAGMSTSRQPRTDSRSRFVAVKVKVVDVPRGPVASDEYGNPIENVYIRKVERVNGELQNTVIQTFPNVSQFWKYNPADYLKQPLYSR